MPKIEFKLSQNIVSKANERLILKGVSHDIKYHNGNITARYNVNGTWQEKEISSDKVKEAYTKSLSEYAKKL